MKTNMRASGAPLVALLLGLLTPAIALADTPREIAKRVSPSVVLLVMEDASGQPLGMGSGFVVRDGIVATNMHVIEGAARGYAKLVDDKTKHDIRGIVASDAARDLVLLSVDELMANALGVGDSNAVDVGDEVYAVGNPRGLEGTFSAGIVSSVRKVGDDSLLQITSPISPGSSGGPVVNSKSEVIGVAVATFKGGQNLNFAIPSQYLSALIPAMKAPIDLPKAAEARNSRREKSILDDIGGRNTDGVVGGDFLWDWEGSYEAGDYSFSLRNKLRDHVRDVTCLVIFYNVDEEPIETDLVTVQLIPAGLARRVESRVPDSVQALTTADNSKTPRTKLEFRVLYFEIVSPDESVNEQGRAPQEPNLPSDSDVSHEASTATAEGRNPSSLEDAEAELRELEKRLAEAVAKIAPAGDGPNLIESRIEGEFEGWDGETIFKLTNGQVWQQAIYAYTYHYAYQPQVTIIKTHGVYKMKVDGVSGTVFVKRIK